MIAQVHDELVFDVPKEAVKLCEDYQVNLPGFAVPEHSLKLWTL